ncbi:hypothetical protein CARUB_v10011786mg, partial [Capsella rubella]
LISEILSRLPEKSVARFRCVSKLWLSITKDPYFIKLFETRSPQQSLLVCFFENEKLFVASIPQLRHSLQNSKRSYSCYQSIYGYHMEFPKGYVNFSTESVEGLICLQESGTPIVWNPSTRQLLTLPKPKFSWNDVKFFLGYDPVQGKHKVMCIPLCRVSNKCRVLTLGSAQESWRSRTIKTCHKHRSKLQSSGQCIKGVVYYKAQVKDTRVWVVMSFDVKSENFDMIQLPSDTNHDKSVLITYEGKLACARINIMKGGRVSGKSCTTFFILEDAKKHKWSRKDVLPVHFGVPPGLTTFLRFEGCTNAGEFIYEVSGFEMVSYILLYDPVKRSCRRFELKGITEDTSMYVLHAFPNHVENQMSL